MVSWLLVIILTGLPVRTIRAQNYRSICSLKRRSITYLQYNSTNDLYYIVNNNTDNETSHTATDVGAGFASSEDEIIATRYCDCQSNRDNHPTVYCPTNVELCGAPLGRSYDDAPLGCFEASHRINLTTHGWFLSVIVIWTVLMQCVVLRCWCKPKFAFGCLDLWTRPVAGDMWMQSRVQRMIQHQPERALVYMRRNLRIRYRRHGTTIEWQREEQAVIRYMIQQGMRAAAAAAGAAAAADDPKPVYLELKTKPYCVEDNHNREVPMQFLEPDLDDNDEDGGLSDDDISDLFGVDDCCCICFQELHHGDTIGDIPCGHTFHSKCLKPWCLRRNTCPLCQCQSIATPHFAPSEENPQTQADPSSNNLTGGDSRLIRDRDPFA